ncbi:MAG: MFS transporter [Bacillota bacterium]
MRSFVVSAVSLLFIRTPERTPATAAATEAAASEVASESPAGAWADIRAGLHSLWANPVLRTLITAGGLLELFSGAFGALIMLFVSRDLGLRPALMGVLFSVGGASSLLGALLAQPVVRRFGLGRTLVAMAAVWTVAALAVPLAHGPLIMVSAFLVTQQLLGDGCLTIYLITATSLRQAEAKPAFLGRVNAGFNFVQGGSTLLGAVAGGLLGSAIGLRPTLFLAAGGFVLVALRLYLSPVARGASTLERS